MGMPYDEDDAKNGYYDGMEAFRAGSVDCDLTPGTLPYRNFWRGWYRAQNLAEEENND